VCAVDSEWSEITIVVHTVIWCILKKTYPKLFYPDYNTTLVS